MSTFAITAGVVVTLAQMIAPAPGAIPLEKSPGKIRLFTPQGEAPSPMVVPAVPSPRDQPPVDEPPGSQPPADEPEDEGLVTPRIVCGMTVIPIPPTADSRMAKPVPADITYHIRKAAPTICAN